MGLTKSARRNRIHLRIRKTIQGTTEKPRLSIYRSNKEIYAQVIDDVNGKTLAAASSRDKEIADAKAENKMSEAQLVGKLVGERAKNGRVKSLADGAREAGLNF
jgi:large subunit ribosomal protein L18